MFIVKINAYDTATKLIRSDILHAQEVTYAYGKLYLVSSEGINVTFGPYYNGSYAIIRVLDAEAKTTLAVYDTYRG